MIVKNYMVVAEKEILFSDDCDFRVNTTRQYIIPKIGWSRTRHDAIQSDFNNAYAFLLVFLSLFFSLLRVTPWFARWMDRAASIYLPDTYKCGRNVERGKHILQSSTLTRPMCAGRYHILFFFIPISSTYNRGN